MKGDIALLRLATPATIKGIPTVSEALARRVAPGDAVTVLGWGLLHERGRMLEGSSTVSINQ